MLVAALSRASLLLRSRVWFPGKIIAVPARNWNLAVYSISCCYSKTDNSSFFSNILVSSNIKCIIFMTVLLFIVILTYSGDISSVAQIIWEVDYELERLWQVAVLAITPISVWRDEENTWKTSVRRNGELAGNRPLEPLNRKQYC
jgi:hypothetical protein